MVLMFITMFSMYTLDVRNLAGPELITPPSARAVIHFPLVHREPRNVQFRIELHLVSICWRVSVTVWPGLTAAPCARPY